MSSECTCSIENSPVVITAGCTSGITRPKCAYFAGIMLHAITVLKRRNFCWHMYIFAAGLFVGRKSLLAVSGLCLTTFLLQHSKNLPIMSRNSPVILTNNYYTPVSTAHLYTHPLTDLTATTMQPSKTLRALS